MANYDNELWNEYTDENEKKVNYEKSRFIYYMSLALGAKKICEAGCNVGNNLLSFPKSFDVHGFDMNKHALEKAMKKLPFFKFKLGDLNKIPYEDSSFDLVFTRGVLIHIPSNELENVLIELLRISKKWVCNLEYFGEDGKMIKWRRGDDLLWYRDMSQRWSRFEVDVISNVDIPKDVDEGRVRFTLVRKR